MHLHAFFLQIRKLLNDKKQIACLFLKRSAFRWDDQYTVDELRFPAFMPIRALTSDQLTRCALHFFPVRRGCHRRGRPSQDVVNTVNLRLPLMPGHAVGTLLSLLSPLRPSVRHTAAGADHQLFLARRRRLFDLYPISTAINCQWIESWCNLSTPSIGTYCSASGASQRRDFISAGPIAAVDTWVGGASGGQLIMCRIRSSPKGFSVGIRRSGRQRCNALLAGNLP